MNRLSVCGAVAAALMAVLMPVAANAVTNDKLAYLTFSAPVQVPSAVLSAGTYRFRLVDLETSRKVIQVLSNDGLTVHAMFLTRPDSRTALTDEVTVTFMETPAGVPAAVKSLFYGAEYRGYEFVYPKGGPIMVAEFVPEPTQPAITYSVAPAAVVPVPEPVAEAAPAFEPKREQAFAQAPGAPAELPQTASPLPLVAVGGLASLLAGLGLGLVRRLTT